jgi:hypothetical protein
VTLEYVSGDDDGELTIEISYANRIDIDIDGIAQTAAVEGQKPAPSRATALAGLRAPARPARPAAQEGDDKPVESGYPNARYGDAVATQQLARGTGAASSDSGWKKTLSEWREEALRKYDALWGIGRFGGH